MAQRDAWEATRAKLSFAHSDEDRAWRAYARCAGLAGPDNPFFPKVGETEPQEQARTASAKALCEGCGVRAHCLAYAIDNGEKHGIWAGEEAEDIRRRSQ